MLERFGTTGVHQTPAVIEKRRATNTARYGGAAPQSSPEVRARTKQTLQARYGVDNVSSIPEVRAKASATMQARLGVPYAMMSPTVRAKSEETCVERYGVKHNTQSDVMKQKSIDTRLKRYGVKWPGQSPTIVKKSLQTRLDHYGTLSPNVFGESEDKVASHIATWGLTIQTQHILSSGKTIDILIPSLNIGIEYCGLYWHNEHSPEPRDHNYHADKMKTATAEGIRLITLFEDEWLTRRLQVENALKSILGVSKTSIGARTCTVDTLNVNDAHSFMRTHHLQGRAQDVRFAVGLHSNDVLVAAMTLGRHHRQGQDALVLNRLCFASDVSIAGGASRLFSAACTWARANGHAKIISWSDNRWFTGGVYSKMGFSLAEELPPDYTYVVRKAPRERLSKQSQKKNRVNCPPGLTEHEWARERGLARVWDCGHKRWEFCL